MHYIYLHGLGQTSSSWKETISYIEKGDNILCPDLFELMGEREFTYTSLYSAFSEYCAEYSEPLHLYGLSLGGILAMQYAIEHPQNVKSMVLIGTQYKMPKGMLKIQNLIFHAMPERAFSSMGIGKKDFINLSKSMMNLNFEQELNRICCPVLVLCGEKDRANQKAARELKKYLSHAELKIIEGAGHEVNRDAPKKLGEVLNEFSSKVRSLLDKKV